MIRNPFYTATLSRARAWKRLMHDDTGNLSAEGKLVLADLARFCRATTTSFTPGDPHTTSMLEGRRETFNRIVGFLHLEEATLHNLAMEENDE